MITLTTRDNRTVVLGFTHLELVDDVLAKMETTAHIVVGKPGSTVDLRAVCMERINATLNPNNTISIDMSPATVAIGTAKCSHKDNFNSKVGRKVALTHALKAVNSKDMRKDIWDAYNAVCKPKKVRR